MDRLKELYRVIKLPSALAAIFITWLLCCQAFADIIEDIKDLEEETEGHSESNDARDNTKAIKQKKSKQVPKPVNQDRSEPAELPPKEKDPAPEKTQVSERRKAPINLKGDGQSSYSRKKGLMILRENVVITQENLRLQADEAEVSFYMEDAAFEKDSVKEVNITGNVKVSKFDPDPSQRMIAHGDRAIFYNNEQKVILLGNARLYRGGDLMRGKRITYDIPSGMVEVDQARGVVQPKEGD